jgi:hypothetical protein
MNLYRQQENGFMRHNQNRRSRGRNRKGPNPLTRSYESNGPDVKVRGTAAHVAEKYMTLARDALSSGDTVSAENYFQHAEHYNRIVMAAQAQFQQERQSQFRDGMEEGDDDDRQTNGRGDRDFNGDGGRDEDDRYEGGGEEVRGYIPRGPRQDQPGRFDRRDRMERAPRHERNERFERAERFERSEVANRSDSEREEQAAEDVPAPSEAPPVEAAPVEAAPAERRPRRRRPPRNGESAGQAGEAAADGDSTNDGAAALAAFPK